MSEKISHCATTFAALVSACVFALSLGKYWYENEQKKVSDWQKVAIYEYILKNREFSFSQLRMGYVIEAQQITTVDIPQSQIQDDVLRKVLLELQEKKLIYLRNDGIFIPALFYVKPDQHTYMSEMIGLLKSQRNDIELSPKVKVSILDIVNNDCGKYTQGALYRKVSESVSVSAPTFYDILHRMRGYEVHLLDDQTWCATYDSAKE